VFDGLQEPEDDQNELVDNDMEIIPLGPESIESNSFMQDNDSSSISINQENDDEEAKIVLALSVPPTNFLPLEISFEELMDVAFQADQQDVNVALPQTGAQPEVAIPNPDQANTYHIVVSNDNLPIEGLIPEQFPIVDQTQVPAGPPE
jgi:hypothetical protein